MQHIIGVDECGYGAYAGPICVCAIRAPADWAIDGLKDSKKLTRAQRAILAKQLLQLANNQIIQFALKLFNNDDIDRLSLGVCHKQAIAQAINELYIENDEVIVDGNLSINHFIKQGLRADIQNIRSEIKADDKYPIVMAASVLGKHYRDTLMIECHNTFPQYKWNKNVGYMSKEHMMAVKEFGLSCLHRKSYKIKS